MLLIFLGLITIGAFICVIWYTETSKKRKQQQLILHREADIQLMNDQNNETSPNNDINDNSINYKADNSHTKNKTKVIIFVLLIVSVALIVTLLILEYSKTDFFTIYDKYCSSTWADVADDGSYLSIDTSPYDTGYFYDDAFKAIENVNKELGLPDSVIKNMESTRALDGRQTYTSGNITVSWSFHPNNGLEVLFESKRFKKKTQS